MNKLKLKVIERVVTGNSSKGDLSMVLNILNGQVPAPLEERLITQSEAARLLSVSRFTVHRMAKEGEIGLVCIRGSRRYRLSEIDAIIRGKQTDR